MKIPDVLTEAQQAALLAQPNKRYITGQRNLAALRLMLDLGLRSAEICSLALYDVDMMSHQVFVRQGKGGQDRILWASQPLITALQSWLEKRPRFHPWPGPEDGGPLLCTRSGAPLETRYLREMVKRLGKRAGIRGVHPHALRHTFATDLYRKTNDIRLVQRALGHKNLSSTQIYTHIVNPQLEKALKELRT